jgi:type I restriction enzyme S subunit
MRSAYLTKSISAATVRAINYTPELGQFLQRHQGADVSRLGNLASIRSPGSAMFRAINCSPEFGEEFLTQADIFAAEPTGRTIRPDTIPDLESRRVKNGQILIAGVGTLGETELYGRSIIADDRLVGKLLTSDTLVLEPTLDEDTHYYVYAFLCTSVGVRLVRSASGSSDVDIDINQDKTLANE